MSHELSVVSGTGERQLTKDAAHAPYQGRTSAKPDSARVEELERENTRLQLLVAELLIKNQQLRKAEPD